MFYTSPDKNQNSKEEEELCTKGDKPSGILPPTNDNTPTETNGNISLVRINMSLFHTPQLHLLLLIYFILVYIQCNMAVNFKRKIYMIQIILYLFKQFWSFIYIVQRLYIIKQILASHENFLLCINNYHLVCCFCNRRRKNQMKTYNCCWRCFLMPAHLRSPIVWVWLRVI